MVNKPSKLFHKLTWSLAALLLIFLVAPYLFSQAAISTWIQNDWSGGPDNPYGPTSPNIHTIIKKGVGLPIMTTMDFMIQRPEK